MQDFPGRGPNLKISGILDIHAAKLRAFARGFGACSPKKIFKNGAILCVFSTTFMVKNPLKKL